MSEVSSLLNSTLLAPRTSIRTEKNHIFFYTEVNRDSIHELIETLREMEGYCTQMKRQMNLKKVPIYLHINSYGGCVFSALNAIDYIQSCQVPIYTVIEGAVASAGTLISVFGKKRYMRPNAHMLIHQLSSSCWGKMTEIEDEYINLKNLMVKIRAIYAERTTIPKKQLRRVLKHDLWYNVDECIENGLVDEVWTD
jgi:ATP-dependent protease ClpP protease subunit